MDGKWRKTSVKRTYENEWVNVDIVDVELPDHSLVAHHIITVMSGHGAGMLVHDPEKGVLLLWRHRFITDQWGWELPGGAVETNESPKQAAMRELTEETGWKANNVEPLLNFHRMPGIADDTCHVYFTKVVEWVGPGRDINEAADIAWLTLDQIKTAIQKNEVTDGMTITSLLYAMQFGSLTAVKS